MDYFFFLFFYTIPILIISNVVTHRSTIYNPSTHPTVTADVRCVLYKCEMNRTRAKNKEQSLTCEGGFMPISPTPNPPIPSLSSLIRSGRVGNPAMELRLFRSMVM